MILAAVVFYVNVRQKPVEIRYALSGARSANRLKEATERTIRPIRTVTKRLESSSFLLPYLLNHITLREKHRDNPSSCGFREPCALIQL
jgi:hypothetical protein